MKFNLDSTRVSNELGAGNPEGAKHAMNVTVKLSFLLSFCFALALGFGHDIWIQLFSDSSKIKDEFTSVTPLLAISIVLDAVQGVMQGLNFLNCANIFDVLSNFVTLSSHFFLL